MKRVKLVYIISDLDKALSFEWAAAALKQTYDVSFILIGREETQLERFLRQEEIRVFVLSDTRYPGIFQKWFRLVYLLWKEAPVTVHTHLWRATLLGISASWVLRIPKRIFTRHHATLHYDQYPSGRKWDRLCNFLATDIIAISKSVFSILTERDKANANKVHIVHHGFQWQTLRQASEESVSALRAKYQISEQAIVIGVCARYVSWKGIQYIIPAFRRIREKYPKAHLVIANAKGPFTGAIQDMLSTLPENTYTEIAFESDLASLYKLFNVYVHVPVNRQVEAFGQTYVEALACGIPSVFTLSGVAPELIVHEHNALVVPFKDSVAIENAIVRLLKDGNLRASLINNGKKSIDSFSFDKMADKLKKIYDS